MRKIKKLALECILMCMEEIKVNLSNSAMNEDVQCNAEALKILADAFKTIKKS